LSPPAEPPVARRKMREGGVLSEGDYALEGGGVRAPLHHPIVYLCLEGPLGHPLLHEPRDVVHHLRDDPGRLRDRLQLVWVLYHPRPAEGVRDVEELPPPEHVRESQVVPVREALEVDADVPAALQDRRDRLSARGTAVAPLDVDRVVLPPPRGLFLQGVGQDLDVPVGKQEEHVVLEEAAPVARDVEEVRVWVATVDDGDDVQFLAGVLEDAREPVLLGHDTTYRRSSIWSFSLRRATRRSRK
jgi:hypothetical protein